MTPTSQERRSSSRVRKKAPLLEDENFVQSSVRRKPSIAPAATGPSKRTTTKVAENRLSWVYGKERPPDAPRDVCAVCMKTANESNEVVLLCDGLQCHREYHLSCANLLHVPADDEPFYCFDCHPVGARTEALQKYLERHVDERHVPEQDEIWSQIGVWKQLIAMDIARIQSVLEQVRIPRSELHHPRPWLVPGDPSAQVERFSFLVGCPVRLYVPQLNDYVAGRVVDYRENNNGTPEHYVRFPAGAPEMKESVGAWIILEEHALLVNTGVCIVAPEPHAAVQSTPVVDSSFSSSSPALGQEHFHSQPAGLKTSPSNKSPKNHAHRRRGNEIATVWTRTSRELLSLKNVQALGIPCYGQTESPWSPDLSACLETTTPATVMIRNFGTMNRFRFVPTSRLVELDLSKDHQSSLDPTGFALAKSELMEKKRIRDWYALQSTRTEYGLIKRDMDELPSLDVRPRIKAVSATKGLDVNPCPLVRPGLDRSYIAQRLQKLGIPVDRTVASRIECEGGKPFYYATSKSLPS